MSEFDTTMVRDLALADEKRNTRIQKYCSFCGQPSKGEEITLKEQALLKCLFGVE